MSCKICGRSSCASWMHSAEQQAEWESVDGLSDQELKSELIDARREITDLKNEIEQLKDITT